MKKIIILQARLKSSRLPDKLFMKYADKTVLEHILDRFININIINQTVIAVPKIDYFKIKRIADNYKKTEVIWGDEDDVLKRFVKVVEIIKPDIVIRATGDNPFVDIPHLRKAINKHIYLESDYTAYRNLPLGTGIEVISPKALIDTERLAKEPYQREHVTPYIWENDNIFQVNILNASGIFNNPKMRLTLDTNDDSNLFHQIYSNLYRPGSIINNKNIIKFLNNNPDIKRINENVKQRFYENGD